MDNKFIEYNLNITDKNKDFVILHLQRIKDFVEKYNIEKELYQDIEDMIFEKLSNEKELTQLNITKIFKEVWEPEIIFSEYIDNNSIKISQEKTQTNSSESSSTEKNNEKLFFENMIDKWWDRDTKNAWFLWVSLVISEKSNLPVWMIRLLFVIFFLGWWFGFLIYAILWIILPIKWFDYKWKDNFWYLKVQLYHFIKDWFLNILRSIKNIAVWIVQNFFDLVKISFKFIIKYIIPIIRFLFFACIALALWWVFLWLIVLWALYFSNISINNIDYTSVLPNYFIWGIITWIYSIWVFMIAFFLFSVSWKWINKYILLSWFVTLVIATFLWASTSFHLIQLYSKENIIKQEAKIELNQKDSKDLVVDINDIVSHLENLPFYSYRWSSSITLVSTKDNILKVAIENNFIWNDEIADKLSKALVEPTLIRNNWEIKIDNPKMFSKWVPPAPMKREITIYIPEWYSIKFDNYAPYLFYIVNAHLSIDEKYSWYTYPDCWNKKIWYSKEEKDFICKLSDDEMKEVKKEYLKKYVMSNFDEISTLRHLDEYKRDYWNDNVWYVDWEFNNFYWTENNILNFEFSDMSLDIRASLKIEESNDKVNISDFKINYVEIRDYYFKSKYYLDISPIKSFLWEDFVENNNEDKTKE